MNNKGIAMLMAIVTVTILGILAAELVYETQVYHRIVYNSIDQLRAQYLAKSGLKIALLQLKVTQQIEERVKKNNATALVKSTDIDKIWSTPMVFPPPVLPSFSKTVQDSINKFKDELGLPGKISIAISSESDKLNINQLVWPFPNQKATEEDFATQMQELFSATIETLLENKRKEDDFFAEKYRYTNGKGLVQNILGWIDPNTIYDANGGAKESYYASLTPPYSPKNAPMASMSELHLVSGFDDELAELVSKYFTPLVVSGVNVNTV